MSNQQLEFFASSPVNQFIEYLIANVMKRKLLAIRIFGAYRKADPQFQGGEQQELQESGANLVGIMQTILGTDTTEYNRITEIYRDIVEGIDSVNVPPIGGNYTVRIKEEGLSNQIDFANFSTGMHQVLILILAVETAKKDQIICIEEPEIHLHANSQKKLLNHFITKSQNNQFIITTHSPIFTGIKNNLITFLVTRPKGISQVTRIEKPEDLNFVKEQLGITNSDIFGNDYTVFIEGDSEEIAFPIIAKTMGYSEMGVGPGYQVRLFNLKGSGKVHRLEQFLDYLKTSDTTPFIIADGDKEVSQKVDDFVRMRLINENSIKIWEKEFEDLFSNELIIQAMQKIAESNGFQFNLTSENLNEERSKNKKVANILQQHLHDNEQPDLKKTDLALEIANIITKEIKEDKNPNTPVENEIKRIFKIVNEGLQPTDHDELFTMIKKYSSKTEKISDLSNKIMMFLKNELGEGKKDKNSNNGEEAEK